jgi:hypothetical protein
MHQLAAKAAADPPKPKPKPPPPPFPSIRIVRVKVTSPIQPDLTFGFTIETGR